MTSIGAFLLGAAVAGRAARQLTSRRQLLVLAMTIEAVATGTAAAIAFAVATVSAGWPRFTIIAVLAFGMGVRNATIRRLSVSDLTTTVLTMTLTGLAADSSLAGGTNPQSARKVAAITAMLAGAYAGAAAFLHAGAGVTLLLGAVIVLAGGLAYWAARESRQLDQPPI